MDGILAVVLGLVAAIGWGISGFFDAKASRAVHPVVASFVVNGILTIIYIVFYFLFLHQGFTIGPEAALYAAGGGAIIAVGALAYFKALSIGPISLTSPMSSAYPLVTTILAVVFFGNTLTPEQGVAIGLIIVGILIVTDVIPILLRRKVMSKGPLLGLATAFCWGIGYAFVARGVHTADWQQATLVELIAMMAAFSVCIPLLKDRGQVTRPAIIATARNKYVVIASTVALVAALSFNIGFTYDATGGAVVATFSAFYPVLTVLLALRHFQEPVKHLQLMGTGVSLFGIILLTIL